jgi:FkbM family methyltransferase
MMDNSGAPRARLFTVFGTVLFIDVASGHLRHGPVESSPANAVFVADPGWGQPHRTGRLMQDKGDSLEPIICLPDHCQTVSSMESGRDSAVGTPLELVPLERGLIGLATEGLFLMADPNGRVALAAQVCSTWECFLASEHWCTEGAGNEQLPAIANAKFDTRRIQTYLVHPMIRKRANAKSNARKVLIYGYPQWSHGRIYYDLCTQLHRRGYIVDIMNWQENHAAYIADLIPFYDLFMTALDGVQTLTDVYGVPYDKVITLSHHELDIRMLIEQKGVEVFDKFANYGVTSEFVYCASLMKGVPRVPKVVSTGVNFAEFYSKIPERLATVGYASSMSVTTYGIEWKRGELAEAAAREAGLEFRVAGSTGNQTSFHDMPEFYRSVDAVLTSSISESAQHPVMEAAAAGRLVIGTPVGHFPRKAYEGGGILAPIEAGKFKAFTVETLRYYKDNPAAYRDKCFAIQEAARKFDWKYTIDDWVELIETAMAGRRTDPATAPHAPTGEGKSSGQSPLDRVAGPNEPRPNGTIVHSVIDGQSVRFFVTNPRDEIMKYHQEGSFYEIEELDIIKRHYTGNGTFLDIGANIGNHAVYVSRFLKSPKIIVFEPNQAAISILNENLLLNDCKNVETRFLGMALGARERRLKGLTPDPNNLGHTVYYEDAAGDVQAIEGDALILDEPVEFIKIDVEGMEIDILSGLEKTIERWRPIIFIEVWDNALPPFLDWCERAAYQHIERFQRYAGIQNYLIKPTSSAASEST